MIPMIITGIEDEQSRRFMESLYEKYRKLIFHVVRRWIDSTEEQNDVAQEVWVKLVEKEELLGSLSESKRVSYLAYCARNTALKRLAELKEERTKLIEWDEVCGEDVFIVTIPSTEETVLQNEWQLAFQKVWETLPNRERLLLEGKYLYGESDRELAEWLGCKPGSVRMALTRARRTALNELIRRRDDEQSGTTAGAV